MIKNLGPPKLCWRDREVFINIPPHQEEGYPTQVGKLMWNAGPLGSLSQTNACGPRHIFQ